MRAKVQKWGNSLAIRIPRAFASEAHFDDNTEVELSLVDGKLVITAAAGTVPSLDELLAGITDDNLHEEVDTGAVTGNEIW